MPKKLGIVPYSFARPLVRALGERRGPPVFEFIEDSSTELAIKLRQQELHGAFLSPIDYARNYSLFRILPGTAATSEGVSESVLLLFRERASRIRSVAADPSFGSEIVLAHLILVEKYDTVPTIVPFAGTPEEGLARADAALCAGDAALTVHDWKSKLDMVDEWTDLTELPYVHGFWVARPDSLAESEVRIISSSGPQASGHPNPDDVHSKFFRYELNDDALAGVSEFFRLAYYHGVLKDIPDIKLLSPDDAGNGDGEFAAS